MPSLDMTAVLVFYVSSWAAAPNAGTLTRRRFHGQKPLAPAATLPV